MLALAGRRLADGTFEQRADDAEREVTLERTRCRPAHEEAGLGGDARSVLEQGGLAETGGSFQDDDAAGARFEPGDRGAEHIELDGALDQRRRSGGRGDDVQVGPAWGERGGH